MILTDILKNDILKNGQAIYSCLLVLNLFLYICLRWAPAVRDADGPLIPDTLLPHKGRQGGKPAYFFHWNSQEKALSLSSFSAEVMLILWTGTSIVWEIKFAFKTEMSTLDILLFSPVFLASEEYSRSQLAIWTKPNPLFVREAENLLSFCESLSQNYWI